MYSITKKYKECVQVDRFLALYWNSSYKARVSPGLATRITAASKLALAGLTLALSYLDPHTFRCHTRVRVALCGHFRYPQKYLSAVISTISTCSDILRIIPKYIRPENVYYHTLPMSGCVLVVVGVTLYVLKLILRFNNICICILYKIFN